MRANCATTAFEAPSAATLPSEQRLDTGNSNNAVAAAGDHLW